MRTPRIDWERVARILRARNADEIIRCPYCKANGVVPYIAEHLLKTHPASRESRLVAKVVIGDREAAGAKSDKQPRH